MRENKNIYHPPYSFPLRPDLGGTRYNFSKEVTSDMVIYTVGQGDRYTKIKVPSKEVFLLITVEEGDKGIVFDASYDFTGQLSIARLWFKSFCSQNIFNESVQLDDDIKNVLGKLERNGTDIALEGDLEENRLRIYHCEELKRGGTLKILDYSVFELPRNAKSFAPFKGYSKSRRAYPIKFAAGVTDNILSLGFLPNKMQAFEETVSTNVDMKSLYDGTPSSIRDFREQVFLQKT